MARCFLALITAVALAGCQVQNPLALGPPRVPAPSTAQSAPYYPATASASQPADSARTTTPRISVSAEASPAPPKTASRAAPLDAAERETIRIVENPSPQTRTASSNSRSGPAKAIPVLLPAPPEAQPPGQPSGGQRNSSQPPNAIPGGRNTQIRSNASVIPASYEQPATTFVETKAEASTWRSR